jgi:biotin synthase-related radical SAM superfamily protein
MISAISRAHNLGGSTHLFSFFAERGSAMENHIPPPLGAYRRVQLSRWLIDNDLTRMEQMQFDQKGRVLDFGVADTKLAEAIWSGRPFETSGCPGPDGRVACNRPYGNEKPGGPIRNFPFSPEKEDIEEIIRQVREYE